MRRSVILVVLVLGAIGAAFAYKTAARDREYRALLASGDAALHAGQTFGAIESYSGAIALRPDSMLAHLRRGETYRVREELESSMRDLRKASTLDPTATRPLEELGDVLLEQRRFRRAAETYERRLRLDDSSARVTYKLAVARYRDGNPDLALAALTKVLRLDERMADAYYLQGLSFSEKRKLPDAQRAFEKAVALAPGFIDAREELVDVLHALGRRADELDQLQLLAGIDRGHAERWIAIGQAHARAGRPELAILALGSALERTPDQPDLYGALGRVWFDMAEAHQEPSDRQKALNALEMAAASPTASSALLALYGRALLLDDQPVLAEEVLQRATEQFPVDASAFLLYAAAAERQSHLAAARQALVDYGALVADERDFVYRATRIATLSLRLDDRTTAAAWLGRASDAHPLDLNLLGALADAQLKNGEPAAAASTVARGLEKDPDNDLLLELSRRIQHAR